MKYLLIFLISINCYADVKVSIQNNINGRAYGASFKTQLEADEWKADNISNDSWGKSKRWVLKTDQTNCLQERDILPEEGDLYTECQLPDDYTILNCDTDIIYEIGHDCKVIVDDFKTKKDKKDTDNLSLENIRAKLLDGSAKLDDLIQYVKMKEGL